MIFKILLGGCCEKFSGILLTEEADLIILCFRSYRLFITYVLTDTEPVQAVAFMCVWCLNVILNVSTIFYLYQPR
jgi:hypothetical protein